MTINIFSPAADGIVAALLSPLFMSLGFFIWDCRWTRSGASAFALNMYKCNVASMGFVVMCLVRGFAISSDDPSVFTADTVGFLILSSTLGIVVGDILWLEALRLLGAKHVIVIDSLKPFAAAILGRVALDEVLNGPAWGGLVLTVLGVGVVSWEEQRTPPKEEDRDDAGKEISRTEATDRIIFDNEEEGNDALRDKNAINELGAQNAGETEEDLGSVSKPKSSTDSANHYKRGYFCAIINVLADSFGSLLTKKYGDGMTTWAINLIRFGFAGVVLLCISGGMRFHKYCSQPKGLTETKKTDNVGTDAAATTTPSPPSWFELPTLTRIGWLQITAGVGFVTFLCPALSNFALFQIALGLAVSLSSIGPLYGLFMDWPFKGRRPTMYGLLGVLLAIAGVVILCVWGTTDSVQ